MNKYIFLSAVVLFLSSCTIYTEKQSEALSQTVYATKDSIDNARVDLAEQYINQSARIVKPPKKRIAIEAIYSPSKSNIEVLGSSSRSSKPSPNNKNRVVIVPAKYDQQTVVVVSSKEYEELLKEKKIFNQIQSDYEKLQHQVKIVDEELTKQEQYNNKMITDLNIMQKKLVEKDLAILQRNIVIIILLISISGATYLRIKGIL
jgi:hypothetical protein